MDAELFLLREKNGLYYILDVANNKPGLETPEGVKFPGLTRELADLLLKDLLLLDIEQYYSPQKLRHSLVYIVLSAFIDGKGEFKNELDIPELLQWDRVFRLNPGPPHYPFEYSSISPIREYLKDNWLSLPLNYASTLEEMEANEVAKLPKESIDCVMGLAKDFNQAELLLVRMLYSYYGKASISLGIFWLSNIITSKDLGLIGYYLIDSCLDEEIGEEHQEQLDREQVILNNLKEVCGYSKKEEIWSCLAKTDEVKPLF